MDHRGFAAVTYLPSRRTLLSFFGMTAVATLASCVGIHPASPPPDRASSRMNELKDSFTRVASRGRDLPGVRSFAQIPDDVTAGMSVADQSLLAAAIYLDARERMARTTHPIRDSEVRAILTRPIDVSQFNRPFLDRRLGEARRRLAADPGYPALLRLYETDPFSAHCEDIVTGQTVPCYRWARYVLLVPRWIDQWGP